MPLGLRARKADPGAPGVRSHVGWSFSPRSDREAGDAIASNFIYHAFPAKVSKASMAWRKSRSCTMTRCLPIVSYQSSMRP